MQVRKWTTPLLDTHKEQCYLTGTRPVACPTIYIFTFWWCLDANKCVCLAANRTPEITNSFAIRDEFGPSTSSLPNSLACLYLLISNTHTFLFVLPFIGQQTTNTRQVSVDCKPSMYVCCWIWCNSIQFNPIQSNALVLLLKTFLSLALVWLCENREPDSCAPSKTCPTILSDWYPSRI